MSSEVQTIIFQLLTPIAAGFGVYAAIRSDLAELKARMINVERRSDNAHERIDSQLHRAR